MRTLDSDLTTAQRAASITALTKMRLAGTPVGGSPFDQTYDQDRTRTIRHTESPYSQQAEIVLNNSDKVFGTADYKGFRVILSYGMNTGSVLTIIGYETNSGGSKTQVNSNSHGKSNGDLIFIAGTTSYNGPWVIEQVAANSFVIATTFVADDGASTGVERQYSSAAPMWITEPGMLYESSPGILNLRVNCVGIPDLMSKDRPSVAYEQDSTDTNTVKDLLTAIVGATLAPYTHCREYTVSFDSEDDLLDTFIPGADFFIAGPGDVLKDTRLSNIQDLLSFTKVVMRVENEDQQADGTSDANGVVHFFVPKVDGLVWEAATAYTVNDYVRPTAGPTGNDLFKCTTAGTSGGSEPTWPTGEGNTVNDNTVVWTAVAHDYTYDFNEAGEHDIYAKAIQKRLLIPNFVTVSSLPDSGDGFTGSAEDTEHSDLAGMEFREFFFWDGVTSNAECVSIAEAKLQNSKLRNQEGSSAVPLNVGSQVHDFVKLVDDRQSENSLGNIWNQEFLVSEGIWLLSFAFGDALQGGFVGIGDIAPIEVRDEFGPTNDWFIGFLERQGLSEQFLAEAEGDQPAVEGAADTQIRFVVPLTPLQRFRQRLAERMAERTGITEQVIGEGEEG